MINRIFQRRLKTFVSSIESAVAGEEKVASTRAIEELIAKLQDRPSNMVYFPPAELRSLVDVPCPGRL